MGWRKLDIGKQEFVVLNSQLSLYLNRNWEYDPFVKVLTDSENLSVVANDAEITEAIVINLDSEMETMDSGFENGENVNDSYSEDANTIVISSEDEVSNDWNSFINEEEADATESESEVDCSELSSGYGTLTFEDWMDLSLTSSPEEND